MFQKHIKNILKGELDNQTVHLLLPMIKKEIKATIHVACTFLKLVHHKIVSRSSPCNTNKKIIFCSDWTSALCNQFCGVKNVEFALHTSSYAERKRKHVVQHT